MLQLVEFVNAVLLAKFSHIMFCLLCTIFRFTRSTYTEQMRNYIIVHRINIFVMVVIVYVTLAHSSAQWYVWRRMNNND